MQIYRQACIGYLEHLVSMPVVYPVENARPFFAASQHIRKWGPKFVIMETVMASLSKQNCPISGSSKFYEAHCDTS